MSEVAEVFGRWSERLLAVTGWVGAHPVDEEDLAHVLLYPTGSGIADRMREVSTRLGLAEALDRPPEHVPDETALLVVAGPWLQLWTGTALALEMPVNPYWTVAAASRGYAMLTVGEDGYTGRAHDRDAYLAGARHLHFGLVTLGVS